MPERAAVRCWACFWSLWELTLTYFWFLWLRQPLAYVPMRKLGDSPGLIFHFLFGLFGARCYSVLAQREHVLPGMGFTTYCLPV